MKRLSHPVVIIRHLKERRSKCSVQPFVRTPGFFFFNARPGLNYDATGHIVLSMEAPRLKPDDGDWEDGEAKLVFEAWKARGNRCAEACSEFGKRPLLLLDSTWRRLPGLMQCVSGDQIHRSLPHLVRTAYPRTGHFEEDPERGLATVEALYLALRILGEDRPDLLDQYHWKSLFLRQFDETACIE